MGDTDMRAEPTAIFAAGVAGAPSAGNPTPPLPGPPAGRMIILACGKAMASMAAVAEALDRKTRGLGPKRLLGIAVARGRPWLPGPTFANVNDGRVILVKGAPAPGRVS